jgi:RNA polymerase sigma-70 factor (ECF subfamily)
MAHRSDGISWNHFLAAELDGPANLSDWERACQILSRLHREGGPPEDWFVLDAVARPLLQSLFRTKFSCEHLVEDAVQEAFLALWKSFPRLRLHHGGRSLRRWVHRLAAQIACRVMASSVQNDRKDGPFALECLSVPLAPEQDNGPAMDEWVPRRLRDVMRITLPRRTALVLRLRFIEGLSTRDTAERLRISPREVSLRQHRGLRRMRELLAQPGEQAPRGLLCHRPGQSTPRSKRSQYHAKAANNGQPKPDACGEVHLASGQGRRTVAHVSPVVQKATDKKTGSDRSRRRERSEPAPKDPFASLRNSERTTEVAESKGDRQAVFNGLRHRKEEMLASLLGRGMKLFP